MSLNHNLSSTLKAIRLTRKLSIEEFAKELCIAKSSLQSILKGKCNLRMDTITHIASHLKTHPLTLLQGQYAEDQYATALLILNSLECCRNLSEDELHEAAKLFHELVNLLNKKA